MGRLFKILLLGGMIFFCLLLTMFIIFTMGFPPVLTSFEFSKNIRLIAFIIALYPGLSFLAPAFFTFSEKTPRKKYHHGKRTKKQIIIQRNKPPKNIEIAVFTALGIGVFSYFILIKMPATFFHMSAPKEYIVIKANMSSAWPARKDVRSDCKYKLLFDTPKISPDVQAICLNKEQWPYYRDLDFSEKNTVILYGEKSYFGYELYCCK